MRGGEGRWVEAGAAGLTGLGFPACEMGLLPSFLRCGPGRGCAGTCSPGFRALGDLGVLTGKNLAGLGSLWEEAWWTHPGVEGGVVVGGQAQD